MEREGHAVGLADGVVEGRRAARSAYAAPSGHAEGRRSLLVARLVALVTVTVTVLTVRPPVGLVGAMAVLAALLGWVEVEAVRSRRTPPLPTDTRLAA